MNDGNTREAGSERNTSLNKKQITMKTLLTIKSMPLLLLFAFSFCLAQAQYYKGSVPDSLLAPGQVLLVMKAEKGMMQNAFNKKLREALAEHYTGPFELVGQQELESAAYADAAKYRYVVNYKRDDRFEKVSDYTYADLVFYDRLLKKELQRTGYVRGSYITLLRELGKYVSKRDSK